MSRPNFCLNSINTDDCPCKDCTTDRYAGCHSQCNKYIEWNAEHKKKLAVRRHFKDSEDIYYSGASRRNKALSQKGVSFGRNKK